MVFFTTDYYFWLGSYIYINIKIKLKINYIKIKFYLSKFFEIYSRRFT